MLQLLLLLVECWVGLSAVVRVILWDKYIQGILEEIYFFNHIKLHSAFYMCQYSHENENIYIPTGEWDLFGAPFGWL
jgi:hypothetical protein